VRRGVGLFRILNLEQSKQMVVTRSMCMWRVRLCTGTGTALKQACPRSLEMKSGNELSGVRLGTPDRLSKNFRLGLMVLDFGREKNLAYLLARVVLVNLPD
jgi:hypothetical protein